MIITQKVFEIGSKSKSSTKLDNYNDKAILKKNNYKGFYVEKKEDHSIMFYENGAHFKYTELYDKLEKLSQNSSVLNDNSNHKNSDNITNIKTIKLDKEN